MSERCLKELPERMVPGSATPVTYFCQLSAGHAGPCSAPVRPDMIADGILAEERLAHHKALCRIGVALGIWVHGPSEPVNVDRLVDRILSLRATVGRLDHAIEEPRRLVHAHPLTGQRVNVDPGTYDKMGHENPHFDGVIAYIDEMWCFVLAEDGSLVRCDREGIRLLDPAEAVAALRGEPRPVRPVSVSVSGASPGLSMTPPCHRMVNESELCGLDPGHDGLCRAPRLPEPVRGEPPEPKVGMKALVDGVVHTVTMIGATTGDVYLRPARWITRAEWDALDPDDIIEPPAPATEPESQDDDIDP